MYAGNGGKPIWNEFITPVGRLIHCYHDKPSLVTQENGSNKPVMLETPEGIPYQKAEYKVALMWPKAMMDRELIPLRQMAGKTRDEAWGAAALDQWFRLQPFLRDGDNPEHNTKKKEYLFGQVYLNFKAKADPVIKDRVFMKMYTGGPQIIGPYNEDLMPTDVYSGCEARVSGVMFATEYSGKNYISVRLNNVQKFRDGERIGGGGRADAKSQFDPLMDGPAPDVVGTQGAGAFGVLGGLLGGTPPLAGRTNIV